MKCPYCGSRQDIVVDSRLRYGHKEVYRRRECTSCERRFSTYETVQDPNPYMTRRLRKFGRLVMSWLERMLPALEDDDFEIMMVHAGMPQREIDELLALRRDPQVESTYGKTDPREVPADRAVHRAPLP